MLAQPKSARCVTHTDHAPGAPLTATLASVVSERYVRLMNSPYDRILDTAWDGAGLELAYTREGWTATLAVRPHKRVTGSGVTQELALADLEQQLGLEPWTN